MKGEERDGPLSGVVQAVSLKVELRKGHSLKQGGRLAEAIEVYERVVAADPSCTEAINSLGNCYFLLKRYGNALSRYQEALAIDPKLKEARMNMNKVIQAQASVYRFGILNSEDAIYAKYREEIEVACRQHKHVVEVNGGNGVLAVLAARAGAEDVTVIEETSEVLSSVIESVVKANDVEKIVNVRHTATRNIECENTTEAAEDGGVKLPRCNLVIAPVLGVDPLSEGTGLIDTIGNINRSIADPCGTSYIPSVVEVVAMLVESDALCSLNRVEAVEGFDVSEFNLFNREKKSLRLSQYKYRALSEPTVLSRLHLKDIDNSTPTEDKSWLSEQTVAISPGLAHAVVFWYRCEFAETAGSISTSPINEECIHHSQMVQFVAPVRQVAEGSSIVFYGFFRDGNFEVEARLGGEDFAAVPELWKCNDDNGFTENVAKVSQTLKREIVMLRIAGRLDKQGNVPQDAKDENGKDGSDISYEGIVKRLCAIFQHTSIDDLRRNPTETLDPEDIFTLAYDFNDEGRYDDARRLLEICLHIEPTHDGAEALLRTACRQLVPYYHIPMLNDLDRAQAYKTAIEAAVNENSIVLDIGTGTGLLAMLASKAGAKCVTACEIVPVVADCAKRIVKSNKLDSTVKVVSKSSTDVTVAESNGDLPSKATVLVSEILGADPLSEGVIPTLLHARRKLLTENATVIPCRCLVRAILVESSDLRSLNVVSHCCAVDVSEFNTFRRERKGVRLHEYSYQTLSDAFDVCDVPFDGSFTELKSSSKNIRITRSGRLDAVVYWFDLYLDASTVITTDPSVAPSRTDARAHHWSQTVFFLENTAKYPEKSSVEAGTDIGIDVSTNHNGILFSI